MKSTVYLYGHTPDKLIPMDAGLIDRIVKGETLLHELQQTPLEIRDFQRITDVRNAIEHNTALLERQV